MKKYIYPILIGILFAGAAFVLYDMQVAEGMGLYFAMQTGVEKRIIFDVIVEVVGLAALGLLTVLPFVWLSHKTSALKNSEQFFRVLVSYLAFMPSISMSYLLHFFLTPELTANFSPDMILGNMETVLSGIRPLILLVILAGGVYCAMEQKKMTRVQYILLGVCILCAVPAIIFSNAAMFFGFWAAYALILLLVDFWKEIKIINWPIYVLLFLQSIYNMYYILAKYHL